MRIVDIIEQKRDGRELSSQAISQLVSGYVSGDVPDYQMSAFAMAVVWRGMTLVETEALTRAMIASGETVPLSLPRRTVDKHSTGGVGDKTTLVVAPLAASFGVIVPKLSGRGLGHTGGTIDKLESIPGFNVDLAIPELVRIAAEVGVAVASPTLNIVPADKKIYALRDATATVRSMPLIVSSIMSKKLALQTDAVVLDVKVGEGAFFRTRSEAQEFSRSAIALGKAFGRKVRCVLTAMERPLGRNIGNALEVQEALATLQGQGPSDFRDVCIEVARQMVCAAGPEVSTDDVALHLNDGSAWQVFRSWIAAQGGDLSAFSALRPAKTQIEVRAAGDGYVRGIAALALGHTAMRLGAGRETKEQRIDPMAGIELKVSLGDEVRTGHCLAVLHTNKETDIAAAQAEVQAAVILGGEPFTPPPPIIEIMGPAEVVTPPNRDRAVELADPA